MHSEMSSYLPRDWDGSKQKFEYERGYLVSGRDSVVKITYTHNSHFFKNLVRRIGSIALGLLSAIVIPLFFKKYRDCVVCLWNNDKDEISQIFDERIRKKSEVILNPELMAFVTERERKGSRQAANLLKLLNFYESQKVLREAADQGDADGQFQLGKMIKDMGEDFSQEAKNWFIKADAQKHEGAREVITRCFGKEHDNGATLGNSANNSDLDNESFETRLSHLKMAAYASHKPTIDQLIEWLYTKPELSNEVRVILLGLAQSSNLTPELNFSIAYDLIKYHNQQDPGLVIHSKCKKTDFGLATLFCSKAAQGGNPSALFLRAELYESGSFCDMNGNFIKDRQQALTSYQLAANRGHNSARMILGWYFRSAGLFAKDQSERVANLQKAKEYFEAVKIDRKATRKQQESAQEELKSVLKEI